MGNSVYVNAACSISALGMERSAQLDALKNGLSSLQLHTDPYFYTHPVFLGAIPAHDLLMVEEGLASSAALTKLEKLAVYSIKKAAIKADLDLSSDNILLIISTTKGNIDLLHTSPMTGIDSSRVRLGVMAETIRQQMGFRHKALVVCNACISGVMAQIMGSRLIRAGKFKHVVVCGVDILSEFVISGFDCLKAIDSKPCRPFDAVRSGVTLGEAAATILLSATPNEKSDYHGIELLSGAMSNDANHISGPSRTGDGLSQAIAQSMKESGLIAGDIRYISAHGTATLYNDAMEAKAIAASGLLDAPLNSFKGYIGHTLGAAGVIESIFLMESLVHQELYPSAGFEESGVEEAINICVENKPQQMRHALKLSSGFGGCNAALLFKYTA
jgi:3-oxoacyl-[acyl-carrier-protein] synthase-1